MSKLLHVESKRTPSNFVDMPQIILH